MALLYINIDIIQSLRTKGINVILFCPHPVKLKTCLYIYILPSVYRPAGYPFVVRAAVFDRHIDPRVPLLQLQSFWQFEEYL